MKHQRSLQTTLSQAYHRFLVNVVDAARRRAIWVVGVAIILSIASLYYTATHLVLDTNTTNMLDPHLSYRQLNFELDRAFPQLNDLIVVVVESDTAERAEDVTDRFAARLHQEPALFQSIYQPGNGPFFERNGLLYLDTEELWTVDERLTEAEPFLGTLSQDPSLRGLFSVLNQAFDETPSAQNQALLRKIFDGMSETIEAQLTGQPSRPFWREELLEEPSGPGDLHRRFVLVKPQLDHTSLHVGGSALKTIRTLAKQLQTDGPHGVRIRLTGAVALADDELGSAPKNAGLATVLSFSLVCFILLLGLRSARLVGSILLTLFIGLTWNAAFAALAIGHVNLISVTFPVLFIGLGVDFGIQFGMRYREELENGERFEAALNQATVGTGGALTLAAITAAISFFSFVPTGYRGLAELGLIAGVGMGIALFANLTLLPALLSLIPLRLPVNKQDNGGLRWLSGWLVRHRRVTLWGTVFTIMGAVTLLPRVEFDFNPLHMKDPTLESVSTFLDLSQDRQTTPYTVSVLADDLNAAEQLVARLERLEEVDKVVTLASYIPTNQEDKLAMIEEMNLVLHPLTMPMTHVSSPSTEENILALDGFQSRLAQPGTIRSNPELSSSMERLAQLLDRLKTTSGWPETTLKDLEGRLLADLPKNLERLQHLLMATSVTLEDLPQEVRDRYIAPDGRARIEVFPKQDLADNRALRQFVRAIQSLTPNATDTPVMLLEGGDVVIEACLQATATTLLGAVLVLLIVLSRLRDTLLVLLPLVTATVLTVDSTVLLDVPLNLANIIAVPLLFGLGIAFGIYLIMRKRSGLDLSNLFHSSTPRAVLFSALTTMASFGTLAFSDHRGTASIGLLLTVALCSALVCTLVILPAILTELETRESKRLRDEQPA